MDRSPDSNSEESPRVSRLKNLTQAIKDTGRKLKDALARECVPGSTRLEHQSEDDDNDTLTKTGIRSNLVGREEDPEAPRSCPAASLVAPVVAPEAPSNPVEEHHNPVAGDVCQPVPAPIPTDFRGFEAPASSPEESSSAPVVAPEVLPELAPEYPGMKGDTYKPVPPPLPRDYLGDLSGMSNSPRTPDIPETNSASFESSASDHYEDSTETIEPTHLLRESSSNKEVSMPTRSQEDSIEECGVQHLELDKQETRVPSPEENIATTTRSDKLEVAFFSKHEEKGAEEKKNERTRIGSVTQPASAVVSGVESTVVSAPTYLSGTASSAKATLMSGLSAVEDAILGPSDPIEEEDLKPR